MDKDRIVALEEQVTHQAVVIDDLSELVRSQGLQIDVMQARLDLLLQRAAASESEVAGSIPLSDQRPPHW